MAHVCPLCTLGFNSLFFKARLNWVLGFTFWPKMCEIFGISGFTSWPKMCEVLGINNCQSLANPAYSTSNLEINTAEFHLICGTWSCNNFCIGYQNNGVRSCCQILKSELVEKFCLRNSNVIYFKRNFYVNFLRWSDSP